MSEVWNGSESPEFQEDALSLHMSDLSPTSELLLSSLYIDSKEYVYQNGRTREVPIETETELKRVDFNPDSTTAQVNLGSQYHKHLKTDEHNPKENQRLKAFSREVLYPRTHHPLMTRKLEQRANFSKREVNPHESSPRGYQSMDEDGLVTLPSWNPDLKNDALIGYHLINGDRHGSFISPSHLNDTDYTSIHSHGNAILRGSDAKDLTCGDMGETRMYGDGVDEKAPLTSSILDDGGHGGKVSFENTGGSYGGAIFSGQLYSGGISNGTSHGIRPGTLTSNRTLSGDGLTSTGRRSVKSLDINNNDYLYGPDHTDSPVDGQIHGDLHLGGGGGGGYGWNHSNTTEASKSENQLDLFMDAASMTEVVLSQIFDRDNRNVKEHSGITSVPSLKDCDLVSSPRTTLVQTNVNNYYDKLRDFENQQTFGETDVAVGMVTLTPVARRTTRSKSSELPLRENSRVNTSYSLSKSWGSSKTRQEFQAMKIAVKMPNKGSGCVQEDISRSERLTKMFRIEQEQKFKRAKEFEEAKLLREAFTEWLTRTRRVTSDADQLCRIHLMRKGMEGFRYAMERRRRVVDEFTEQRKIIMLAKCWEVWQQRTRESLTKKKQETFTQWHYYKLHEERGRLLESIANKHVLAKSYSKWKARFNEKQKNSIATLHFKINLVYRSWQCWTLYTKQRRVKNYLNSIARYCYGERTQRRLFLEWRNRTQKSLLCGRLARRRILLKAFFDWKHWTQYAKIVHLRLHNMCKEYHKRCLMKHSFRKWRQALRMKQAEAFWKNNQVRRTLKLWKLRHMRKVIHKYLCKALAKKAKKRRIFERWTCFTKLQKESRSRFVKLVQNIYIRMLFNDWRNEATRVITMRQSLKVYQVENSKTVVRHCWESWKFQMKIMDLRKRCKSNWSLRCVRRSCEVWKLKFRKEKLGKKLEQNRSIWELLFVKRFFRNWKEGQEKARADLARSLHVASILKNNSLARIFQAWRVVNQEECIIEPLVKRRERKEMARVYDAWHQLVLTEKHVKKLEHLRINLVKSKAFVTWRHKLWCITKRQEVEHALHNLKLRRHFLAWIDYIKYVRHTERIREQKKADMTRKFVQIWKENTKRKAESREREKAKKAYHRILLLSYFTVWRQKAKELTQRLPLITNMAETTHKRFLMVRALKRWSRQYTIVTITRDYLQQKKLAQLKESFLAWRTAAKEELQKSINKFCSNLDSSFNSGSLSTSGYQTMLKNSFASFQSIDDDEEVITPVPTPRSRPLTPIMFPDDDDPDQAYIKYAATLLSYRPVTTDRQNSLTGYQTPPITESEHAHYGSPLTSQRSVDQTSQSETSPQRSSEDDDGIPSSGVHSVGVPSSEIHSVGVPSSGVHSAGEESDQEDQISIHLTESVSSFQTTSEGTPGCRELLVADTIIHWRSLSLSVAFRSWFKYTQHRKHLRVLYGYWADRNREIMLIKILEEWRRWLFVTVLARQHWVMHLKKSYISVWINYRRQQILNADRKDEADLFSKNRVIKGFFRKWKNEKTTKGQLQRIVGKWQRNAVITNTEKVIIQQYQEKSRTNCLRRTFHHWKKQSRSSKEALHFWESLLIRRCLGHWKSVACYRADIRKTTNTFRNNRIISKAFTEWLSRYKDNRTAKILLGVSEERRVKNAFRAWQEWAVATSYRTKTSLAYHRSLEQKRLRTKFIFWLTTAKQLMAMKEHYHKSLQRRVLLSWKNVQTEKANTSGSIQDFQEIAQRNMLQTWFVFWRKRTQHNQLLSQYLKQRAQRNVASKFERWRNQKKKSDARTHCLHRLKKKMFTSWQQEIVKRKKARQHFKNWQTIAEGRKDLNQVADSHLHNSQTKLLKTTFCFWRKATSHAQLAQYHHSTKVTKRFFIEWNVYIRNRKRLSSNLKEFQMSHLKNNFALLKKYMKTWQMKSRYTRQAENLYNSKMSSKYWKVWRHNYVRQKVSSAMVEHDNKKVLSKVFVAWYNIASSHSSLSKEFKNVRLQRWFRRWMERFNNS